MRILLELFMLDWKVAKAVHLKFVLELIDTSLIWGIG